MKRIMGVLVLIAMLTLSSFLKAQVPTGTPAWASLGGGTFDVVNLGNLNAHFSIAVRHKAGRVTPFVYDVGYDSSIWYPATVSGNQTWQPVAGYGWTLPTGPGGSINSSIIATQQQPCSPPGDMHLITHIVYAYYKYTDPAGASHPFNTAFNWFSERNCSTAFGSGGAYFAVSSDIGVPLWMAEMVAGGYSITHHPPSDWVGPFGMDPSATRVVSAGYGAKCGG